MRHAAIGTPPGLHTQEKTVPLRNRKTVPAQGPPRFPHKHPEHCGKHQENLKETNGWALRPP